MCHLHPNARCKKRKAIIERMVLLANAVPQLRLHGSQRATYVEQNKTTVVWEIFLVFILLSIKKDE